MIRALVPLALVLLAVVCFDFGLNDGQITATLVYLACPRSRCGLIGIGS